MEFLNWLKQALWLSSRIFLNLACLIVIGLFISELVTPFVGVNFVPFCVALIVIPIANSMYKEICDVISEYSATNQFRREASERLNNLTAERAYNPLQRQPAPRVVVQPTTPVALQPGPTQIQEAQTESDLEDDIEWDEEHAEDYIAAFRIGLFLQAYLISQMASQSSAQQHHSDESEVEPLRCESLN